MSDKMFWKKGSDPDLNRIQQISSEADWPVSSGSDPVKKGSDPQHCHIHQ